MTIITVFFGGLFLAILFSQMMYGVGLAVVYKMVRKDNASTAMSMSFALLAGSAFFMLLLTLLDKMVKVG